MLMGTLGLHLCLFPNHTVWVCVCVTDGAAAAAGAARRRAAEQIEVFRDREVTKKRMAQG